VCVCGYNNSEQNWNEKKDIDICYTSDISVTRPGTRVVCVTGDFLVEGVCEKKDVLRKKKKKEKFKA
jgi:hypothetical protein